MRATRMLLVLPAVLVLWACMEGDRVIKVNADGSGTIVDTMKLGEQARTMIESMEAADTSTPAEKRAKKEAKLRERAAAMGEGVTFVVVRAFRERRARKGDVRVQGRHEASDRGDPRCRRRGVEADEGAAHVPPRPEGRRDRPDRSRRHPEAGPEEGRTKNRRTPRWRRRCRPSRWR